MGRYIQIENSMPVDAKVPGLIKVLPLGLVKSRKGNFLVDMESFQSMERQFRERALDIPVDYEHQTLSDQQAPAAGWIKKLELKSDGIYAVVEWTPPAREYLQNREYRYLSPVINVRQSDHKAMELHSVALTNKPAIDGMTPVVNSDKPAPEDGAEQAYGGADQSAETFLEQLKSMLGLPETASFSELLEEIGGRLGLSANSTKQAHKDVELVAAQFELHRMKVEQLVETAMKEGKVTPAMKGWAFKTAMRDYDEFHEWYTKTPPVIPLGELMPDTGPERERRTRHSDRLLGLKDEDIRKYGTHRM